MPSTEELIKRVNHFLDYRPLPGQELLIGALCNFIEHRSQNDVFLLTGYAGTGKTSITAALVKALDSIKIQTILLAPTGRAAKVFSSFAQRQAYTIHKRLYRINSSDPSKSSFFLAPNKNSDTLFIVDEASMIPDIGGQQSLLSHLIQHVYSNRGCNIILIGDTAQLPPIGQPESPAMNRNRLRELGLNVYSHSLTHPIRQAQESGILYNATIIRHQMTQNPIPSPSIWVGEFNDVEVISSEFFAERVSDSYAQVGQDNTIIITRSNKRATLFNRGIRGMVLYAEEELQRDERLVVAKNNYFWTHNIKEIDFIANGDVLRISWLGSEEQRYGHRFIDAELEYPNSEIGISVKLMLDTLTSDSTSLNESEMNKLFLEIASENENSDDPYNLKILQSDPYYNALQVKYAYCLTCHKAQGGQWKHVYIDMGYLMTDSLDINFYRWLYTAITRASEKVFFVNPSIEVK